MTIQSLIDEMIQDKKMRVPIFLEDVKINAPVYEPRFSDFKRLISFDSTKDKLHLKTPFLDESERSKLRFTKQLDVERSDLSGKGFAAKVKSNFKTEAGGLVVVEHKGLKIQRKFNDYRYDDVREVYKEVAYFMFDEESGQYVQCISDEIRQAERLIRTMMLEELEAKGKYDASTIEFLARRERANQKLAQLQQAFEEYRDRLYEMLNNERDNLKLSSQEHIEKYLKNVRHFLSDVYKPLASLYFVFNKIDEGEYLFHEKTFREASKRFNELMIFYRDNKEDIFSPFAAEKKAVFNDKISYFKKLFQFKKSTSEDLSMGYFVEELKKGNTYRTLIQIDAESIYYTKDEASSEYIQAEQKEALIKKYKI